LSDRGLAGQEMVGGKIQFNAAAAAGNGQVTDVSKFREVIVCRK